MVNENIVTNDILALNFVKPKSDLNAPNTLKYHI